MNSYVFGLNFGPEGPTLDYFINVNEITGGAQSFEECEKLMAVRLRLDPNDMEAKHGLDRLKRVGTFLSLRPRFMPHPHIYKVDFESDELKGDLFEKYLQSLSHDELDRLLEKARI